MAAPLAILLIKSPTSCRKCRDTEAVLRQAAVAWPGRIVLRSIDSRTPEADAYGAVLPPMVIVDGTVLCAGIVPSPAGLQRLLSALLDQPREEPA